MKDAELELLHPNQELIAGYNIYSLSSQYLEGRYIQVMCSNMTLSSTFFLSLRMVEFIAR
jgi:hypothetical protein